MVRDSLACATNKTKSRVEDNHVTAKFNGRRASENKWVTQQNLAKAKGGRPQFRPRMKDPKLPPVEPKVTPDTVREP